MHGFKNEDDEPELTNNKKNTQGLVGKLNPLGEKYDQEEIGQAIDYLCYQINELPLEDLVDSLHFIHEYTMSKEFKFQPNFLKSNFITAIIAFIKNKEIIQNTDAALDIIANIWYANKDPENNVLYDEELIDSILGCVATDNDALITKSLSALSNAICIDEKTAQNLSEDKDFMDFLVEILETDKNYKHHILVLRLLLGFSQHNIASVILRTAKYCADLMSSPIPKISSLAANCIYHIFYKNAKIASESMNILEAVEVPLQLGFSDTIKYIFPILNLAFPYFKNWEILADEKFMAFLNNAMNKLCSIDSIDLFKFMTSIYPFITEALHEFGLIELALENAENGSFLNRIATALFFSSIIIDSLPDMFSSISDGILALLVSVIEEENNQNLFLLLRGIRYLFNNFPDLNFQRLHDPLKELTESEDQEISEFAQSLFDEIDAAMNEQ